MSEFKPGEFYEVDWSNKDCCCGNHSDDTDVVFIKDEGRGYAEVAYSMGNAGICVGYVPYSALSEG